MDWITGEKILERWGEIDDKLIEVFKGGLYPYRDLDGARLTPDSKCFRCRNANDAYIAGEFNNSTKVCERPEHFIESLRMRVRIYKQGLPHLQNGNDDVKTFFVDGEPVFDASLFNDKNLRLRHDKDFLDAVEKEDPDKFLLMFAEGTCSNFKDLLPDRKELFRRLKAARFRLKDVERYEVREGIGRNAEDRVEEAEEIELAPPATQGEPTNAAEYAAWRTKDMSIHRGQIMLEIQGRWGKTGPSSTRRRMRRAEIAQIVLEPEAQPPDREMDADRWLKLEFKFKNYTSDFKRQKEKSE